MKRLLSVLLACALSTMAVPAFALEPDSNQTASPGLEQPSTGEPTEEVSTPEESDGDYW